MSSAWIEPVPDTHRTSSQRGAPGGRRTPSADVRQALVDAAVSVLERDGYAGLTVRAVAVEAGVAPMGVYNHFAGKPGLVAAVLGRGFDGLTAAVTPPVGLAAGDRLRACGIGYRRFALANPVTYTLMFGRPPEPGQAAAGSESSAHRAARAAAAFQALVTEVEIGQRHGSLAAGDPPAMAQAIWAAVHGAVSLELAGTARIPDLKDTYTRVLEMIERGLAPGGGDVPSDPDVAARPGPDVAAPPGPDVAAG